MFRTHLRRAIVLSLSLVMLGANLQAAESTASLYSILKDFFKDQLGPVTFVRPDKFVTPIATPDQQATWYERAVARNLWRDHYVVKKDLLDVLLKSNGEAGDVIGISAGAAGLDPTNPDVAFDPTNNRYLVVWEEETEPGVFNILGQFRDVAGTATGSVITISSPRTNQGCFYAEFDADNGDISTPNNCPAARNPAVAFNNGRYLVAWELQGRAEAATNYNGEQNDAGKEFSNIIAKVVNATDLAPTSGDWGEGIMISKVWTASNVATPAVSDGQIQAWGLSINPDVAPKAGGDGFVVTWQSNKDYIGCVDPNRRDSSSVYARYVDQNFSPTGAGNKPIFAVYTDPSTATSTCPTLDNVMRAAKPRIAFNSDRGAFVVAFEFARAASATKGDIGGKKVVLNGANDATVSNSMAPEIVAEAPEGSTFHNPDVASFKNRVYLVYDNGSVLSAKKLTANGEVAADGNATNLDLGAGGAKTEPRWASSLGITGTRPSSSSDPEVLLVGYRQGNNALRAAVLDENFAVTRGPLDVSSDMTTGNHVVEVASDFKDFFVVWAGVPEGMTSDQVFGAKIASASNNPPTGPVLGAQPADGVTWAPTRLYLSWTASTDPDPGNTIVYDVYFAEGATSGATPYKSGLTVTEFVIQASTDNRPEYNPDGGVTPVHLEASSSYKWKICARDNNGGSTCSSERTFNTDNSVKGWWRFDDDPNAIDCTGEAGTERVCDSSGNNNHGTQNGGVTWLPAAPDILGRALGFDGVDNSVSVENSASTQITNQISILASVKLTATSNSGILDKLNPSPLNGYNLDIFNNRFRAEVCNSSSGGCNGFGGTTALATGVLYRVTTTYDQVSVKLFLDSTMEGSTPVTFSIGNNSLPISIGNHLSTFLNGSIQDLILCDRAMGTNELQNDYNSSQP